MSKTEIRVPDIGDFEDVLVIEVHAKPGMTIAAEDSLITLESDKAAMDVPAPRAGKVAEIKVKVGDRVKKDSLILTLDDSAEDGTRPIMSLDKPAVAESTGAAAGVGSGSFFVSGPVPPPQEDSKSNVHDANRNKSRRVIKRILFNCNNYRYAATPVTRSPMTSACT